MIYHQSPLVKSNDIARLSLQQDHSPFAHMMHNIHTVIFNDGGQRPYMTKGPVRFFFKKRNFFDLFSLKISVCKIFFGWG